MASNLLILYNEVFVKARAITNASATFDTFSLPFTNYLAGKRWCYGGLTANATSCSFDIDLGTSNTLSLDYMIVAGLPYLHGKTGIGMRIQTSSDGSSYSNAIGCTTDFHLATKIGDSQDVLFKSGLNNTIGTPPTTARRWFRFLGDGNNNRWIFSKWYAGTMFDMGKSPDSYAHQTVIGSPHGFRFPTGNISFSKLEYPLLRVEVVWRGITDAKCEEFFYYMVDNPASNFVFLHTTDQHAILAGKQLLHCEIIPDETKRKHIKHNYNEIRVVFMEARG